MTIQQVISSGKPFRNPGMSSDGWYRPTDKNRLFSVDEIMREDWEIKREPREFRIELGYEARPLWPPGSPTKKTVIEEILVREVIE